MSKESLSFEDVIQIVHLIESSSHFRELHLKVGEIEIDLRAKVDGDNHGTVQPAAPAPPPVQGGEVTETIEVGVVQTAHAAPQVAEGVIVIRSPMMGTFYRAPEPGAAPFVSVGSRVEPGTTVCIIEVMKLMSSIPAECSGVVRDILVEDAQLVQTDQPLIVVDPEA